MQELDHNKAVELLNAIISFELAGVVRYTYYSLIAIDSKQTNLVNFFKEQASESLTHAQKVGEILTSLSGQYNLAFASIDIQKQSMKELLAASWQHETKALELYNQLLGIVSGKNVYIEEFVRNMIAEEGDHSLELKNMLEDFSHQN
jgi:bacterioferritin